MSAPRNPVAHTLVAIALMLPLFGCSVLLPKNEPQQIITPQVHVAPDPAWPKVAWQLAVARPNANDMLDSRRMAVIPSPGQIQVYKGVSWDDTVPNVLQDAVVNAFEDSGKILGVAHQTSGLRTDFALQLDIRDYQAVYRDAATPPEVTLVINAKLIDYTTTRAVASRTFRQTVPASGTAVPAVAQAFDTALSAFAHDVVGWSLSSGEEARSHAAAALKR